MADRPEPAPDRRERARLWLRRAAAGGYERDTVVMIGKSTLAAGASWAIAYHGMGATSPAFAPFAAVWMMQATVYQSLVRSLQVVGAVTVGVALQGVIGFMVGAGLWTFLLVALLSLTLGHWPPLGSQGPQVATAAFFAFSTYVAATTAGDRLSQLASLIALVLVGCGVGVATNLLVLPPMRYRGAEYGLRALARELHRLLADMHPVLREGTVAAEYTETWRGRAASLDHTIDEARAAVRTARESLFYNPRRLLPRYRHRSTEFSGYDSVLAALERVSYQLASLIRSLHRWDAGDDDTLPGSREFLRCYSALLGALTRITGLLTELDEDRLTEQVRRLEELAAEARTHLDELVHCTDERTLPLTDTTRPYGVLLTEAVRLTEECEHASDVLGDTADRHTRGRPLRHG